MFRVMRRGAEGLAGAPAARESLLHDPLSDLFIGVAVLVAVDRIIFAQRMPVPIDRHQDSHHVRMIAEFYAEYIEHLALMPVGRAPHAVDGIDFGLLAARLCI